VPLAHRGLHGDGVPENSLAAFVAARAAGYGVELDVQLTRDRVPVVLHDPTLLRVAGSSLRVAQATVAQLRRLRLEGTDGTVPTLAEALAALGDAPVMVECKSARLNAGRLEERVAGVLDDHPGPACVAGFNPSTLRWFRRHRPAVVRVLTAGPASDYAPLPGALARRLATLRDLPAVAPAAISYGLRGLPTPPVDRWRADGGAVITWTVTDATMLARARQLADNVIFETVRP
jgi:glycerophosphoryl diester phosphodiesterase